MLKRIALVMVVVAFMAFGFAIAAPLFPDVPAEHWARDAVANLAAKGMLEGYPDGTFKGDRAATRWEVAMVVARLLAKMEQDEATFASKADLEELQKLVDSLKDELAALGVRVGKLEDKVGQIDKRVTDLERIRFSGELDSIFVTNGFHFNDARFGYVFPGSTDWSFLPVTFANVDLINGRPYMIGTGFSSKGALNVTAKVSDDVSAGLSLVGFISAGDEDIDQFYGVSAPYLNNFFQQRTLVDVMASSQNIPYTRMNVDNFFVKHNPSGVKLVVGSFDAKICPVMYVGQLNPNVNGPKYLNNYGFQVTGSNKLWSTMDWEVFYTKLADGNVALATTSGSSLGTLNIGTSYDNFATGLDLMWKFDKGSIKLNLLRAANDFSNSFPQSDRAINDLGNLIMNAAPTTFNNSWSYMYQWINPSGYVVGVDFTDPSKAPVRDSVNSSGLDSSPTGFFDLGPQTTTNYGLTAAYEFASIKAKLAAASSQYKPNHNSSFSKSGTAFDIGLATTLVGGALDLGLDYLSVDPYYDPFIIQYPYELLSGMIGVHDYMWRLPDLSMLPDLYQLHDSCMFPNNRNGIKFNGAYKFAGEDGKISLDLAFLTQQKSSVYNENHTTPATFPGAGDQYTGFTPGWTEPVFSPINPLNPTTIGNAFLTSEDNKGKVNNYGIGVNYNFPKSKLGADLGWWNTNFHRDSGIDPTLSANNANNVYINYIDLKYNKAKIGLVYPLNDRWTLKGGYEMATLKGHHAYYAGLYGLGYTYNADANNCKADNIDMSQTSPYLGFDYQLSKDANWGLNLKFLNAQDKVADNIRAGGAGAPAATVSHMDWTGIQLFTEVKIRY